MNVCQSLHLEEKFRAIVVLFFPLPQIVLFSVRQREAVTKNGCLLRVDTLAKPSLEVCVAELPLC